MIDQLNIEKALLDLGASGNLLPYSVYKQLGLEELKLTTVTLQLADKSGRHSKGVIEDALGQIENIYFPMDFIIIDTVPVKVLVFKSPSSLDIYFELQLMQLSIVGMI